MACVLPKPHFYFKRPLESSRSLSTQLVRRGSGRASVPASRAIIFESKNPLPRESRTRGLSAPVGAPCLEKRCPRLSSPSGAAQKQSLVHALDLLCRSAGALFVSLVCPINMPPLPGLLQIGFDSAPSPRKTACPGPFWRAGERHVWPMLRKK